MMKKIIIYNILLLISFVGVSQAHSDSLWYVWEDETQEDTVRLNALNNYNIERYLRINPDSGIYFAELAEQFAQTKELTKYIAIAKKYKGSAYLTMSKYDEALIEFKNSLVLLKKTPDSLLLGKTYSNIGVVYERKGNYDEALAHYNRGLIIYNSIDYKRGQSIIYNNLGVLSMKKGEYKLAQSYYLKSVKVSIALKDYKTQGANYLNIGIIYMEQGDYTKSKEYSLKSLEAYKIDSNDLGKSNAYNSLGNLSIHQGLYVDAIDYYTKCLKIFEKNNSLEGLINGYNNLGTVYKLLNDPNKGLEYYIKSLDIALEIGSKRKASVAYKNIGSIYAEEKQYDKAISFFKKSLKINKENGYKRGEAGVIIELANLFINSKGAYSTSELNDSSDNGGVIMNKVQFKDDYLYFSEQYYSKGLEICKSLNIEFGVGLCYLGLGQVYDIKDDKRSEVYLEKALKIGQKLNEIDLIKNSSEKLYLNHKKNGNYKRALEMQDLYVLMKDSINSDLNKKELYRQESKMSYEKQAILDSISHVEAQRLKEKEIIEQKEALKNKRFQQYILFGGLGLLLLFSIYVLKKNKEVKNQKLEVEKQKEFAEHQQEIAEIQKEALDKQNKEIKDSIQYAQNLQRSLLPSERDVEQNFNNNFILFKPKDIVSGDFYWTFNKNQIKYLAVVDCTGHGVPGAFMTIVANNLLTEIIQENFKTPKEIIEELHQRIKIKVGGHKDAQVRDSMDLGMFSYNESTKEVLFVGTHTSLSLVRNNKLETIKGSKADIGYKPTILIEEHRVLVQENDMLYMHSDGYPDQKGGNKGKKFYYKPIRDKFEEISLLNLMEQEQIMSKTFEDWKGNTEQFDDVCMIGVRI